MDLYQLIRDLIDEAKKQKNLELVEKLIEIKIAISDIQEENKELKRMIELEQNIERHSDGNYVTIKDDPLHIQYCSTCWGNEGKLIQIQEIDEDMKKLPRCPICFNKWLMARNSGK